MKPYNILLLFLFLFFGKNAMSQSDSTLIQQVNHFKYAYQNERYTKRELSSVINTDAVAYVPYTKFRKLQVTTRAAIAIGVIGIGVVGLDEAHRCYGDDSLCPGFMVVGAIGVAAIGTAGVTFLISRIKFYKSVRLFNEGIQDFQKVGSVPIELQLECTENGVGLVYRF